MKKAISLVEVLVSIMLITTVIAAILQMKDNNLFQLSKFQESSINNSYITLAVSNPENNTKRNKNIYLDKVADFDDDDIRRELKKIKVKIKDIQLKEFLPPRNDYIKSVGILESSYSMKYNDKSTNQKFYTFKLEQ